MTTLAMTITIETFKASISTLPSLPRRLAHSPPGDPTGATCEVVRIARTGKERLHDASRENQSINRNVLFTSTQVSLKKFDFAAASAGLSQIVQNRSTQSWGLEAFAGVCRQATWSAANT